VPATPVGAPAQDEKGKAPIVIAAVALLAAAGGGYFFLQSNGGAEQAAAEVETASSPRVAAGNTPSTSTLANAAGTKPALGASGASSPGADDERGTSASDEAAAEQPEQAAPTEASEQRETEGSAEAEAAGAPSTDSSSGRTRSERERSRDTARRARAAASTGQPKAAAAAGAEEPEEATEEDPEPRRAAASSEPSGDSDADSEEGDGKNMNALLDKALGGSPASDAPAKKEPEPDEGSNANLPDQPSRAAVRRALAGLMPTLRQCADEQVGLATAAIMVKNDGSVTSATVTGQPFGGPQRACMEKAIKGARFPRFKQSTFRINYPFSIRH
jgi:hypothetical protein